MRFTIHVVSDEEFRRWQQRRDFIFEFESVLWKVFDGDVRNIGLRHTKAVATATPKKRRRMTKRERLYAREEFLEEMSERIKRAFEGTGSLWDRAERAP